MLLSACSDYFQSLFSVNPCQHPIVILKDVNFEDLRTVVQFMYNGIVNVSSEKLPAVLKVRYISFQNIATIWQPYCIIIVADFYSVIFKMCHIKFQTADTLQIKGLGEKYSESVSSLISSAQSNTANTATGSRSNFESSTSSRLLSVPSQHSGESRQLSTESLPEFLHR